MSKIIAIHQPNYIPWLGYFYKIYQADTFVFLDDVQYSNKGMHDFHYIKTPQGRFRMKIPVKVNFGDNINQVIVNDHIQWKVNQLKQLESNYKKTPHFNEVYNDVAQLFDLNVSSLSELNIKIIQLITSKFGISTDFVVSSALAIEHNDKNARIFEICTKTDAAYTIRVWVQLYIKTNRTLEIEESNSNIHRLNPLFILNCGAILNQMCQ